MISRCRSPAPTRTRVRGFTLIELMIAIVVVGILAAAAYPLYTDFVRRSRITDATNQLSDYRIRMEQAFQDLRRYDNPPGFCAINPLIPAYDPTRDNFQFACVFNPGVLGGYTLTATGNPAKGMTAFSYNLVVNPATGALNRGTVSVPAGWLPLPVPNDCWQVRKGGYCS